MKRLKLAPVAVFGLVACGAVAARLAAGALDDRTGFAPAAGVALWFLGFTAAAFVVAGVAAGVAIVQRRRCSRAEMLAGLLPLPLLVAGVVLVLGMLR
jgi:hypothetical protein